jgi:2-polyprenyl-6-methoxyphenol hydroxylase-like FAD-dependent oxidoreductase
MSALKPITIAGGGLAGLTLGIGLRRREVPVAILEAGRYPRHRVCGEFISGRGQAILNELALLPLLEGAGAVSATTVQFISGRNRSPTRRLAAPALCLSRYSLDALLAKEFQRLGGELRENTRATVTEPREGFVRASGRRAQPTESGWRWFGVKAHARAPTLTADLEMHVSSDGYVGVNRIDHDEVNVCGLFRTRAGDPAEPIGGRANLRDEPPPASPLEWLRGRTGSPLRERLAGTQFDEESVCTVAGLSLKPRHAATLNECCLGDALTMIPPVTGNGMSMAFESAALAIEPLAAYSRGERDWRETQRAIARACDAAFARRLAWAQWLQWLMFSPVLRTQFGAVLLRSDWLWRWMFANTR